MAKYGENGWRNILLSSHSKIRKTLAVRWQMMSLSYIYFSNSLLFIRRTGRHLSAVLWIRNDLFQIWLKSYRQRVRTFIGKYFFIYLLHPSLTTRGRHTLPAVRSETRWTTRGGPRPASATYPYIRYKAHPGQTIYTYCQDKSQS